MYENTQHKLMKESITVLHFVCNMILTVKTHYFDCIKSDKL